MKAGSIHHTIYGRRSWCGRVFGRKFGYHIRNKYGSNQKNLRGKRIGSKFGVQSNIKFGYDLNINPETSQINMKLSISF